MTATMGTSPISKRIGAILAIDPSRNAIEFGDRWWTWGQLESTASKIADLIPAAGTQVGIILHNRPEHIGALLGVLRAGGCGVTINPYRGVARTRAE